MAAAGMSDRAGSAAGNGVRDSRYLAMNHATGRITPYAVLTPDYQAECGFPRPGEHRRRFACPAAIID
jgi:hypothetical protein